MCYFRLIYLFFLREGRLLWEGKWIIDWLAVCERVVDEEEEGKWGKRKLLDGIRIDLLWLTVQWQQFEILNWIFCGHFRRWTLHRKRRDQPLLGGDGIIRTGWAAGRRTPASRRRRSTRVRTSASSTASTTAGTLTVTTGRRDVARDSSDAWHPARWTPLLNQLLNYQLLPSIIAKLN